ncbi:MAG: FGGY-family carbohydrate kinase [Candidatus Moduliflexus flocculans]|nr:FGGY-family carbohydrate kinase [Candidatus Moduliflexus flocculans]
MVASRPRNRAPGHHRGLRTVQLHQRAGLGGKTRFLKNISGFWLVQQCRRWPESDPEITYDRLGRAVAPAAPFFFIDPDDPVFLNPPDMLSEIKRFCHKTIQPVPESPAEITRCIPESLALKYRYVLEQLRKRPAGRSGESTSSAAEAGTRC